MGTLRRRALFALPVVLPVAAVAAKVAPKPFASGGVVRPGAAWTIGERGAGAMVPLRIDIDGDAIRRIVKAEADRIVSQINPAAVRMSFRMNPGEGAADAAKPVTAQVAAPLEGTTSRSLEADASDSPVFEPVVPAGNDGTSGERDTLAQPVAA